MADIIMVKTFFNIYFHDISETTFLNFGYADDPAIAHL